MIDILGPFFFRVSLASCEERPKLSVIIVALATILYWVIFGEELLLTVESISRHHTPQENAFKHKNKMFLALRKKFNLSTFCFQ